jgi:hypothetical protein
MNCARVYPQTDVSAPGGRQGYREALPGHDAAAVVHTAPGCATSRGMDDASDATGFLVGSRLDQSVNPPGSSPVGRPQICQLRQQLPLRQAPCTDI